jgi:predicted DNA-binding transcriptional regulator AlpA
MTTEPAAPVSAEARPEVAPAIAFVGWTYISARVPIHRTTAWRWMRANRFPKCRQLGPGRVGWVKAEVDAWLAQAAGR